MCGIAGIVGEAAGSVNVAAMMQAIAHRGPDGAGAWVDPAGYAALGHRRLAVIDLSSGAGQPMSYADGRYWITFNGEIYNHRELRDELRGLGERFQTQSDTEVVLAGWARWGEDSLSRLRGMFAFALWDRAERRLALVRDRLGIKPLLWTRREGKIIFASELKALLACELVSPVIDERGLIELLATGAVCQPRTMIAGVQHLAPGTCLLVSSDGAVRTTSYWNLTEAVDRLAPDLRRVSYRDAVQMTRSRLEEGCRAHLVSDVQVGSFLSGGSDSAAITALMRRYVSGPLKTFCLTADEADGSGEAEGAARVAALVRSDHAEIRVAGSEVALAFDDLVWALDQPSDDGANTYLISRAVGAAVKVVLSGLGGDELFAGYPHFSTLRSADRPMPAWITAAVRATNRWRPNRYAQAAELRQLSRVARYARLRRGLSDDMLARALSPVLAERFAPGVCDRHVAALMNTQHDSVRQTSELECRQYLRNSLLRDSDATSMRHGLEMRPVMLDHPLVEFAIALPADFKLRRGRTKAVLKDAVADLLPRDLLKRSKTGFELPTGRWLRGVLRERLADALGSSTARLVFAETFLQDCSKRVDHPSRARMLWTMLVLITWMRAFGIRMPARPVDA